MTALDTGICAQESMETLLRQQQQLRNGLRHVQMFPKGTIELPVPLGFERFENDRGAFHFLPSKISRDQIDTLSADGRENEFLNLGPFSKSDIASRVLSGEMLSCITEYSSDGVELRCAAATENTIPEQLKFFQRTKEPDSRIVVGVLPPRVCGAGRA